MERVFRPVFNGWPFSSEPHSYIYLYHTSDLTLLYFVVVNISELCFLASPTLPSLVSFILGGQIYNGISFYLFADQIQQIFTDG